MLGRKQASSGVPQVDGQVSAPKSHRGSVAWWVALLEDRLLLNLATVLMAGSAAVMFYEAGSRTFLSESHWWAEELVRFLVVWSVMLAFGVATRRGNYIRMELLVDALPPWGQRLAAWLNCLAGLAFAVLFTIAAWRSVVHLHVVGMMTESSLDLPLWFVRLALPIGGLLYALYFVRLAVVLWRGGADVQPNAL
jgi:C4-dicarboxylate transporter, DctQ subunit